MPLKSNWFAGNSRLQKCLISDPDHVVLGDSGQHVLLIQQALRILDNASIDSAELASMTYGKTTAAATLNFKSKRSIINKTYQQTADNIVGKMTIDILDKGMQAKEMQLIGLSGLAAPFLRGMFLAPTIQGSRNIIVVTTNEQPWLEWAQNFKKGWLTQTSGTGIGADFVIIPKGAPPAAVSSALTIAATKAGSQGVIILSTGHGGSDDDTNFSVFFNDEKGNFDLGPGGTFIVGGVDAMLTGDRPPKDKPDAKPAHVAINYDVRTPIVKPGMLKPGSFEPSRKDRDEKSTDQFARTRLENFKHFEKISNAFRGVGLCAIVLLTCRVGKASGFMKRIKHRWGATIIGYPRKVMGQPADSAHPRARIHLEGDALGSGTNTALGEHFIPISHDMVVIT